MPGSLLAVPGLRGDGFLEPRFGFRLAHQLLEQPHVQMCPDCFFVVLQFIVDAADHLVVVVLLEITFPPVHLIKVARFNARPCRAQHLLLLLAALGKRRIVLCLALALGVQFPGYRIWIDVYCGLLLGGVHVRRVQLVQVLLRDDLQRMRGRWLLLLLLGLLLFDVLEGGLGLRLAAQLLPQVLVWVLELGNILEPDIAQLARGLPNGVLALIL